MGKYRFYIVQTYLQKYIKFILNLAILHIKIRVMFVHRSKFFRFLVQSFQKALYFES